MKRNWSRLPPLSLSWIPSVISCSPPRPPQLFLPCPLSYRPHHSRLCCGTKRIMSFFCRKHFSCPPSCSESYMASPTALCLLIGPPLCRLWSHNCLLSSPPHTSGYSQNPPGMVENSSLTAAGAYSSDFSQSCPPRLHPQCDRTDSACFPATTPGFLPTALLTSRCNLAAALTVNLGRQSSIHPFTVHRPTPLEIKVRERKVECFVLLTGALSLCNPATLELSTWTNLVLNSHRSTT